MTEAEEMDDLRARIAATFARREQLKQAMGAGSIARREQLKQAMGAGSMPARQGFRELEAVDKALSALDSRFKQLWDAQQADKGSSA